jgi:hypothetical protein
VPGKAAAAHVLLAGQAVVVSAEGLRAGDVLEEGGQLLGRLGRNGLDVALRGQDDLLSCTPAQPADTVHTRQQVSTRHSVLPVKRWDPGCAASVRARAWKTRKLRAWTRMPYDCRRAL